MIVHNRLYVFIWSLDNTRTLRCACGNNLFDYRLDTDDHHCVKCGNQYIAELLRSHNGDGVEVGK